MAEDVEGARRSDAPRRFGQPLRNVIAWALPLLLFALLFSWPLTRGPFGLQVGSVVAVYAIGVIGVDLVIGRAGMLQFGYGVFFGTGAYTVAMLAQHTDLPSGVAIMAAPATAGLLAAASGTAIVGVSGYLFGLVTLSASVALESFVRGEELLGGSRGIAGISRNLVGTGSLDSTTWYILLVAIMLVAIIGYRGLRDSRAGRSLEALRRVPHVAEASGVPLKPLRFRVWVGSGIVGGFAGGLFAVTVQFVSPELIGVSTSISFLIMNVIGGAGVAWAGIPGAVVVRGLVQAVQALRDFQLVIAGIATVAAIVWFRRGLAGSLEHWWRRLLAPDRTAPEHETHVTADGADGRPDLELPRVTAPELRVESVAVHYSGVRALRDVSLRLEPGRVTALVGANGSGKTTLVNVVSGRTEPTRGRLVLGGTDITDTSTVQRVALGVTRTFQLVSLCDTLTALENVMLGGHTLGRAGLLRACIPRADAAEEDAIRRRALAVMAALGIDHIAHEHAADLAAGPRRLVEISRCLMTRSSIVLLDEPASGLNPDERNALLQVIEQLRDSGRTVLLIEHDMRFVMNVADRLVVLNEGTKLADGEPRDVSTDRAVLAAYIGMEG